MKSTRQTWLTVLGLPTMLLALTMWQSGCGNGDTGGDGGDGDASTSTDHEDGDHGDHSHDEGDHDHDHDGDHADGDSDGDEVTQALSELSPEDREIAMAQEVCPVGDGPLGGMGVPVKVEHEGRVVFLCCKGCVEAFEEDPEKYIAVIDGDGAGDDTTEPETTEPEPESDGDSPPETEETDS